jgi:hypothetical protein
VTRRNAESFSLGHPVRANLLYEEIIVKRLIKWFLLGLFLAAFVVVTTPVATAQGPVTLKVYNPTGGFEVTQTFAPRLADLNGKTICLMGHSWEADRTFPLIMSLLQKQFPAAKFVDNNKLPNWTTSIDPKMVDAVKAAGCQAVIVGNAG